MRQRPRKMGDSDLVPALDPTDCPTTHPPDQSRSTPVDNPSRLGCGGIASPKVDEATHNAAVAFFDLVDSSQPWTSQVRRNRSGVQLEPRFLVHVDETTASARRWKETCTRSPPFPSLKPIRLSSFHNSREPAHRSAQIVINRTIT